jgi:hypothetical protein
MGDGFLQNGDGSARELAQDGFASSPVGTALSADQSDGADAFDPQSFARSEKIKVLAGIGFAVLLAIIAGIFFAVTSGPPPQLHISLSNRTTAENPVPAALTVDVDGASLSPEWSIEPPPQAKLLFDDAFAERGTEEVTVTLNVPEPITFSASKVGLSQDGNRVLKIIIEDDSLQVVGSGDSTGTETFTRLNPEGDRLAAAELAREAEAVRRAEWLRVEESRVTSGLQIVATTITETDDRYSAIFDDPETGTYTELEAVVKGEILPVLDVALGQVNELNSTEPLFQRAIDAAQLCLSSQSVAMVRVSSYNPNLSVEEQLAEVNAAWDAEGIACADAYDKIDAL